MLKQITEAHLSWTLNCI